MNLKVLLFQKNIFCIIPCNLRSILRNFRTNFNDNSLNCLPASVELDC